MMAGGHGVPKRRPSFDSQLREHGEGEVEHDPGVHTDPGHRQHALDHTGDDAASPSERRPPEHHLVDGRAVADDVEEAEEGAAEDVADRDHDDRLEEAEAERDPQGAQHPIDRGEVGSEPDPELLGGSRVARPGGDRLDPVGVEGDGVSRWGGGRRCCRHGILQV